jgi:hypothetical protein
MNAEPIPTSDAASQVDADLVARAYRKVMNKEELTKEERRALKRHEAAKEERLRWKYYRSIPQKHWRAMGGRQTKVLNEQAARYGIPFGGSTISLPDVVRALHDFLSENAQKLARDDDLDMQGSGSPALERYREERAAMARLDRLAREGQLLPRDDVREALGRIASIIRSAGDMLQRHHGAGALDILTEALDDAQRELDRCFGPEEDEPDVDHPVPDPE